MVIAERSWREKVVPSDRQLEDFSDATFRDLAIAIH